jgi:hypothetical protein
MLGGVAGGADGGVIGGIAPQFSSTGLSISLSFDNRSLKFMFSFLSG